MTSFERHGSLFLPSNSRRGNTPDILLEDSDLSNLLEGFVDTIHSAKGSAIVGGESDDRVLDAEGVLLKVAYHCLTAVALSRGTSFELKEKRINFLDPASITVICRSAFESVITFHFVFRAPKDSDLRDFRYLTWVIHGLLKRQKFEVNSTRGKKTIKNESEYIDSRRGLLQKNPVFLQYDAKSQREILKRGLWNIDSPRSDGKQPRTSIPWWEMGERAGFEVGRMKTTYNYLSQYSHGTSLSVLQIRQAKQWEDCFLLVKGTLSQLKEILSVGIVHWCALFEASRKFLGENPILEHKVGMWAEIANTSLKEFPDES